MPPKKAENIVLEDATRAPDGFKFLVLKRGGTKGAAYKVVYETPEGTYLAWKTQVKGERTSPLVLVNL
jgi:hypothetical protein